VILHLSRERRNVVASQNVKEWILGARNALLAIDRHAGDTPAVL
jgi:hypothetical protein